MKKSELLTLAKECLWDGGTRLNNAPTEYVCIAVCLAAQAYFKDYEHELAYSIRDDIHRLLNGSLSIAGFIGPAFWAATVAQRQDYRKRWIDVMIANYKANGE